MSDTTQTLEYTNFELFIRKFDSFLGFLEDMISVGALCCMTLSVLVAVILRYVLGVPNIAGEEVSRYLFVTMVYMGISICARERTHLGVTIFVDHLPPAARKPVIVTADLITLLTFILLGWLSWIYVASGVKRMQYSPATGLPISVMYAVMALGLTMSAFHCLLLFWNDHLSARRPLGQPKGATK